jgi:hypothetical protein
LLGCLHGFLCLDGVLVQIHSICFSLKGGFIGVGCFDFALFLAAGTLA